MDSLFEYVPCVRYVIMEDDAHASPMTTTPTVSSRRHERARVGEGGGEDERAGARTREGASDERGASDAFVVARSRPTDRPTERTGEPRVKTPGRGCDDDGVAAVSSSSRSTRRGATPRARSWRFSFSCRRARSRASRRGGRVLGDGGARASPLPGGCKP